jgi:hypothetical protein
MRVLLPNHLSYFAGGVRYRYDSDGTEVPPDIPLPHGTKVWDGKTFVEMPDSDKSADSLRAKAQKAAAALDADALERGRQPPPGFDATYKPVKELAKEARISEAVAAKDAGLEPAAAPIIEANKKK